MTDSKILNNVFYIWAFVLIARPQDFIDALIPLRPAVSISVVVLILFAIYHGRYKTRYFDNPQCRLYIYLLAVMIISIPFAYYRRGAFEFVFTKYIITVVFFFIFYKIIDSEKKLHNIIWIACLGTSLYLLCAMYRGETVSGRLKYGDMFDPNDLAFFALSFLPFNNLFLSKNDPWWKRIISLFNIIVSILVILMTGSRGGFIALGVVVLMLLFAHSNIVKNIHKVILAMLVVIAIVYGGLTIDFSRFKTITQIGEDYNVWDETGRLEVWKRGIELMMSDPLTGVGITCFDEAIGRDRVERGLQNIWQPAHNSIVQIGVETGIIGMALFVLISYKAFRIFSKAKSLGNSLYLLKIGEMARIGFAGHFVSSMFLSQAYSLYWVYFVALSSVLLRIGIDNVPSAMNVNNASKWSIKE